MNTVAALPSPDSDPGKRCRHCEPGEYEEFLADSVWREDRRRRLLGKQRRFAKAYPDLDAWMQLPLQIRLGWRNNETQSRRARDRTGSDVTTDWINFNARHYLFYLSLTGRLRLDWGWLLGVGVLKPWTVAESLGLPLFEQADALAVKHRELGLSTKLCRHGVHWGVARLVLHAPILSCPRSPSATSKNCATPSAARRRSPASQRFSGTGSLQPGFSGVIEHSPPASRSTTQA